MACHYPSPEAAEILRKTLVQMNFRDVKGIDANVSEYGVRYRRITAQDDSPEALADMAVAHIKREFDSGAEKIVWRKIPVINGFEEKRQHTFALVLEYHVLPIRSVGSEAETNGVKNAQNQPSDGSTS